MKKGPQLSSSKLLEKKWQASDYFQHVQRLKQIKSAMNLSSPKDFPHLKSRAKKDKLLEDKYIEIERENKILLHKMQNIIKTAKDKKPHLATF